MPGQAPEREAEEKKRAAEADGRAMAILSYGDNSAEGLARKLSRRGFSREEAEGAVARMMAAGYLREEEQAYRFAVMAAGRKCWGPRRILHALLDKGYDKRTALAAIRAAEENGDIDFKASARALLAKKFGESTPAPVERKRLLYTYGYEL